MKRELTPKDIKFELEESTDVNKIEFPENIRAYSKILEVLNIKKEGYNLYVIDSFSKERINSLKEYIEKEYQKRPGPKDICYVVIGDEKRPEPLFISNGRGGELKEKFQIIKGNYLHKTLEFYNTSSCEEKDDIIEEINDKRSEYIQELMELAKGEGFDAKATTGGFVFIPLKDGEAMTEGEYDSLVKENREVIARKAYNLKKKAEDVLASLKELEDSTMDELRMIFKDYLEVQMNDDKDQILLDFIGEDEAYNFLETLFERIEDEIVECYTMSVEDDEVELSQVFGRYDISVIVDNKANRHPQVIFEEDPSIVNLLGEIEYRSSNGVYTADVSLINAGSLLKANEGCIILRLSGLISNNYSYYYLKKVLLAGKQNFDTFRNYLELLQVNSVKPKAVPVDIKVIIIGDYESFDILYKSDEEFKNIFPVKVEFERVVKKDKERCKALKLYIENKIKQDNLLQLTDEAYLELVKYLSRRVEDRKRMSIDELNIDNILTFSNNLAINNKKNIIDKEEIIRIAYEEDAFQKEVIERFTEKKVILKVEGGRVGAINGLSVYDLGYCKLGKPIRITCIVCKGEGQIIDVQKESNLSGNIHGKSLNILKGVIHQIIGPYKKIPVNFHLSFEQVYGMIEGDSASVAQIICMLSALSKKPIKQGIAVTGSINQFGEIQPIGGVNEKIEGFYNVCKALSNEKNKGVLIPESNGDEVLLRPEVEQAIINGDFHIYTMESLEDAIEVLMLEEGEDINSFYDKLKDELEKYESKEK